MKVRCALFIFLLVTTGPMGAQMFAGVSGNVELKAVVVAGALEVETASAELEYSLDMLSTKGVDQIDAVNFLIEGLRVNDLNGDGRGWRLSALPEPLSDGSRHLEVGTISGFVNFDELEGISTPSPSELLSTRTGGIAEFDTDYAISYTIPAFAPAGNYSGTIYFSIAAE